MNLTDLITEDEARAQKIPGSDVFVYSHLLYKDDRQQAFGVCQLNIEAYKVFLDTVQIKHFTEIALERKEVQGWLDKGGFTQGTFPPSKYSSIIMHNMNLESFKIGSGFELHLKARLLAKGFLIHKLNPKISQFKSLHNEQREMPISKSKYFEIDGYRFDGKLNRLVGLSDNSITFSQMIEEKSYCELLSLTDEQLGVADDYRKLRNAIHLPGDIAETPYLQKLQGNLLGFLIGFINSEIVGATNKLIDEHEFNHQKLKFL